MVQVYLTAPAMMKKDEEIKTSLRLIIGYRAYRVVVLASFSFYTWPAARPKAPRHLRTETTRLYAAWPSKGLVDMISST